MARRFLSALTAIVCVAGPVLAQDLGGGGLYEGPQPSDFDAPYRQSIRDGLPRGLNGSTLSTGGFRHHEHQTFQTPATGGTGYASLIFRSPIFRNEVPACDDPGALGHMRAQFAQKERRYWNSTLTMAEIDRVRQTASNPWGQNNIPRRYCTARVHFSDGKARTVTYALIEDHAIIGSSTGVEWCVQGLDRGRSFDPACQMARPRP